MRSTRSTSAGGLGRRPELRTILLVGAFVAWASELHAQQPLFTFVHTSDSQPQNTAEWQGYEDVLQVIAAGGQAGALLPRKPDFVVFAGDLVWAAQDSEFLQWRSLTDSYLLANGIPLVCVPGNHDVNNGNTDNYQEHIGTAAVFDFGSAAFTAFSRRCRAAG